MFGHKMLIKIVTGVSLSGVKLSIVTKRSLLSVVVISIIIPTMIIKIMLKPVFLVVKSIMKLMLFWIQNFMVIYM